ncbi:sulfate adenylyltransferase subunit CysN [Pontibacter sp. G13]|uniref:sulfate adenylyltransferase subunit CysN n=1 Tax=Pontibacter sp. G13 TaxID=3074898 RepID=UPI00288A8952|nr:sulfate adenylyltransferase subunit CysN [Pontibacter sp. G13]WNJ19431.1 sulfate adenylyltransferase subunit CysN [Pontibacter sp. G13]
MDLLRFSTAGSVDDGKSTLIGRLLYDTKSIFQDQLESIERTSEARGDDYLDLALLTDGLKAEREQGITIDVAYRYFATPRRKFILADTPGHIQYTRNMVTGASTVNLAIILIDARHGVVEQTRRHSFIASLLQIKHVIVAINKMDLVDYSEEQYNKVVEEYKEFSSKLNIPDIRYIPMSALKGDNVVERGDKMPWFEGSPLLYTLETVQIGHDYNHVDSRFPVQYVIRPQSEKYPDYRGYAGRVAGGVFKPGDEVMVLPSGFTSKVKSVDTYDGPVEEAFAPMSVTITLEDDIDISRGDMIVKPENKAEVSQDIELMLCWMNEKPLQPRGKYKLKHTSRDARCIVKDVRYKVDVNTLHRVEGDNNIGLNDIGRVLIRTTVPLMKDSYTRNRYTGSVILIDEFTNETVAAGMIL